MSAAAPVRGSLLWRLHLAIVVVAVLGLLVAVVAHGDSPEANVGAGLFYLLLMTLGMPWSLVLIGGATALGGAVDDLPVWTGDVMVVLAAGVNLEIHRRLRRRRARRYDDGPSGLAED